MIEQILLEDLSKHIKDQKPMRTSQHGFMKGKLRLANMKAFYNEMTVLVDEQRAADAVYCPLSQAFGAVSHHVLMDKLRNYGLTNWTVGWIEKLPELVGPESCVQRQEVQLEARH